MTVNSAYLDLLATLGLVGICQKLVIFLSNSRLIWSEEFNLPAGSAPNPETWARDLGDGSSYGIPGWGNNELQVYTEENAFINEFGQLELEAREITDGSAGDAYYGPIQWTSARLVTKNKAPLEALGTLHGPGYFGDHGCGGKKISTVDLSEDWHEFGICWKPDQISWQLDGETYFVAKNTDVAPSQWVYNQPFSMLLNLAVGGNLGGELAPDLSASNKLLVDYIRVHEFEGFGKVFQY